MFIKNISQCLDNFSKLLDAKVYSVKVEYEIWRKLSKATCIEIQFEASRIIVHATQPDDTVYTTFFSVNIDGFGKYLFDIYHKEKAMVTSSTNNIINNIDTNTINCDSACVSSNRTITQSPNSITTNYYLTVKGDQKEENNMNTNKMFNFDFGPCGDNIRMSMYGLAVKNQSGEWVSYDSNNGEIVNVDVFNIAESGKWFYKMPVSVDDVAVGDLLIHSKKPCYVVDFNENTLNPIVIDIFSMERKEILLQKNMFGFNFATKVVSLFDGFGGEKPSAKNPFGNMLPFLLMCGEGKNDDMLPFVMMSQFGSENTQLFGSPLMMYLMMKGDKNSDMLPLMLMMNQQKK